MSEYEPITAELRAALDVDREFIRADGTVVAQTFCVDRDDFERLCDAIDAVHAGLERENAELRERVAVLDNERGNMHDGGSITDELRKVAVKTECANGRCEKLYRGDLEHIADRIDVEHQKALDEWKAKHGQMWLKGYSECHAELLEGNETLASDLERCGWIRLPKDADGEYIHVGDVMEWVSPDEDFKPAIRTVDGVGEQAFFAWTKEDGRYAQYEARAYRHHHAPTVEDVLREFLDEAEHGWVRLPVDADGVPINVGDVVEYADGTLPKEVLALVPPTVVMVDTGPRYADMCRHHHAPTVEDVLREFANEVYADADNEIRDRDFLCAKYAKRLTLVGDAS